MHLKVQALHQFEAVEGRGWATCYANRFRTGVSCCGANRVFKPEVWEEWAYSQEKAYKEVIRYTGAGDMDLDILGFRMLDLFDGP